MSLFPLSPAEIAHIAGGLAPRESFGPDSDRPLLPILLAGSDPRLAGWLAELPCPVIGIGGGPLAEACDVVLPDEAGLATIAANVERAPFAAMVLVQHLRASQALGATSALVAESFAFGTVQAGRDFRQWQAERRAPTPRPLDNALPLMVEREGDALRLTMNRASANNAIDIALRDALAEAFDLALLDESIATVELRAAGRCFSVGGDVAEFGSAADPATAHWVRSLRLPAQRLARLRSRLSTHVRGGAVGAGIEIAAFSSRLTATPDAWFQLPELKYGLIPGAGGTVSIPRRIGRQRTAYMALSMRRVSAATALEWGLIDAIEE